MKYIKKPVIIDAVQWTGDNFDEIEKLCAFRVTEPRLDKTFKLFTLEGNMYVMLNDWVIKGIKGECYPCKPDIFDLTYEKVEDDR